MPGLIAKIHTGSSTLSGAILCLGLAACGSPSGISATAPQATRPEQPAPPLRSEPRPMNDTSKAPASAPKLSSRALQEKILALVQGIQGPDFSRYADDKEVQVYLLDEKRYDPQRRHTCALPLAGLQDQLKAMGYRDSEFPGPDGLPQAWQYWKGRQSVLVDYTYHDTPAGGQAACVHAITIEMIVAKQVPLSPPELPARQVESIIFGLIDGVRTKADLTEPRIEELTGLILHRLDSRDASYAKGTTAEGWRFSIGIERFAADDVRLEIAAIPMKQSEGTGAAACTLAFETLHRKLDAADFRSDKSTGVHGKASNWRFSRNGQVVHVDLYPTEPLDRGGIKCIDHISVVIDRAVN